MEDLLVKWLNCKIIRCLDPWYYSFWLKGHYCYIGLIYPQPYESKSGYDYYTLLIDNKTVIRKCRFEECIKKLKEI